MNPTLARIGAALSAFAIFCGGWFMMQTDVWWKIVLATLVALGGGIAAQYFARFTRREP